MMKKILGVVAGTLLVAGCGSSASSESAPATSQPTKASASTTSRPPTPTTVPPTRTTPSSAVRPTTTSTSTDLESLSGQYLATGPDFVYFLSVEDNAGSVSGEADTVFVWQGALDSGTFQVTGQTVGNSATINFSASQLIDPPPAPCSGFNYGNVQATFNGNLLSFQCPQSDGTIGSLNFTGGAAISDYNEAISLLESSTGYGTPTAYS